MQSTDTYSMGVLMWELYACRRAWSGLLPPQVIIKVGIQKARLPPLPGAPAEYQVRARWAWPRSELFCRLHASGQRCGSLSTNLTVACGTLRFLNWVSCLGLHQATGWRMSCCPGAD